ncbi:MAG TPA: hypothetical protein DDZ51_00595 [Planctomycetaceae bacterium]|nr:hypothetical protein [Planctomycetaceae bacterium]
MGLVQQRPSQTVDAISLTIMDSSRTFRFANARSSLQLSILWVLLLSLPSHCVAQPLTAEVSLGFGPHRDMAFEQIGDATVSVTLQPGHPHFWTTVVPKTYDPQRHSVLALEYFAPSGLQSVVLRYRVADGSMVVASSVHAGVAETWQPMVFNLSRLEVQPASDHPEMRFHFVLNGIEGTKVRLRNLRVREPNAEEKRMAAVGDRIRQMRLQEADAIADDLRMEYPGRIDSIIVGPKTITLTGHSDSVAHVVGIEPHQRSFDAPAKVHELQIDQQLLPDFRVEVDRYKGEVDRATWRWRLTDIQGNWTSIASWPTQYEPSVSRNLPQLTSTSVKGIGGVPRIDRDDHPIFELGVSHATINIVVHSLIRKEPAAGWEPWPFEGATYFINTSQIGSHDTTLRNLANKNIIVSAILLVGNGRDADGKPHNLLTHPDAEVRGIYSIPNLTEAESTRYYRAALTLMAERWSREDGAHGRVSNWIMHNEIDQAGTWTNMGEQPLTRYLETYSRSARLMHHISRLYDPHSRVFISLTHHWTKKSSGTGTYVVRDMLQRFAEMARAEGDFPWGIAYHPYPLDLRNPDTWNDTGLTNDFDTPYITPKNIEVLPAFLDQPAFHYDGKVRGILLSEQGFNSPTLSELDQSRQAAGLVFMFRKLKNLNHIEAYHLHRYQDMPDAEGGLRLGVISETGDRKTAWNVYKAIGTPEESQYDEMVDRVIRQTSKKTD